MDEKCDKMCAAQMFENAFEINNKYASGAV